MSQYKLFYYFQDKYNCYLDLSEKQSNIFSNSDLMPNNINSLLFFQANQAF